jgi:hypothetical protein
MELNKCVFDTSGTMFFGFVVSGSGLCMNPDKANAIVYLPWPMSGKGDQQLLGLWNFYRRCIHNVSAIVSPITDLLRQGRKFLWGEAQGAAFLKVTLLFTSGKKPIPRQYDPDRPTLLETDASDFTIGGILSQKFKDSKIHPVSFVCRKLNLAKLN